MDGDTLPPTNQFRIRHNDGTWHDVKGEPVSFPGFDAFEFFVYRANCWWSVTEKQTGFSIGPGGENKTEAIAEAQNRLNLKGVKCLKREIRRVLNKDRAKEIPNGQ